MFRNRRARSVLTFFCLVLMMSNCSNSSSKESPSLPRFQVTPENRLFVFYYVSGRNAAGKQVSENRVLEILSDGTHSPAVRVPLRHPLNNYFTATPRGGSPPSKTLELLGTRAGQSGINYARVRLHE